MCVWVGVHSVCTFLTFCEKWQCMIVFSFFVVFFMKEKGRKVGNWRGCKFSVCRGCGIR